MTDTESWCTSSASRSAGATWTRWATSTTRSTSATWSRRASAGSTRWCRAAEAWKAPASSSPMPRCNFKRPLNYPGTVEVNVLSIGRPAARAFRPSTSSRSTSELYADGAATVVFIDMRKAEADPHSAEHPRGDPMKKVYPDAAAALKGLLRDDMTIAAGGFGLCGIPENLIAALARQRRQGPDHRRQQRRRRRLRHGPAAQDAPGEEGDRLVRRREQGVRAPGAGRRARAAADAAGHARREAARRRRRHPRLLHAHRLRAPSSPKARRRKVFDGKEYVLEEGIRADLSIVKAWKGDKSGNLVYRKTSRNFNPMIATCGKVTRGRGRGAGRGRRARPRPDPHAGHLRRSHHPGRALREAHRVPHGRRRRPARRTRRSAS